MSAVATMVSAEELLERARELAVVFAERAPHTAELRRLPDENIAQMQGAGFFRMLQPARWGGLEVEPRTFFDVQMIIAAACPSSAWVLGVVGVHAWQLGLFPLAAQQEVWGDDPGVLISSSYAPTGKIERTRRDGVDGYSVSGRWSFSSGCDHCQWVFLGGFVPMESGAPGGSAASAPDMRTFLLPRGDYTIEDNWHTMGLKGTGSKDIIVDSAFVPEHRTHKLIDGYKRKSPGNEVNPAPLYRLPFGQIFVRSVATSAIGIAQGALDVYCEGASKRIAASDKQKVAEDPTAQVVAARAAAVIDEVKLVLYRDMEEMMENCRRGEQITVERRVRFRYNTSVSVDRCLAVVDELFTASGGRAIFLNSPILRFFLDAHAARAHYANNPEKPARNFGGVQLKLKNVDFFI